MIKKEMEIPVLFTPDENFMLQTCVAILSMQRMKKEETKYHYYILVSSSIHPDCFVYLDYLKKVDKTVEYTISYFETNEIDQQKIFTPHVTSSTYYRLFASDIYAFDRCIYNDGDIVVCDDLSVMYKFNMEDLYVAGVKAIVQQQGEDRDKELLEKWNFPSMSQYIVAGNLVLNLKKLRDDKMVEKFHLEIAKGYPQQDQDVLNFCCYDKIGFLPLKYGVFNRWLFSNEIYNFKNQIYEKYELKEAISSPAIVHFAGGIVKPWVNTRTAYADVWWEYAKELLPEYDYNLWFNKANVITKQRDWQDFMERIQSKKRSGVYIFGYTWIGMKLISWLRNNDIHVSGFIDNDLELQGTQEDGMSVFALQDVLVDEYTLILIASQRAHMEIYNQLIQQNINGENIIFYRDKEELYFQSLAPNYREQEYRDLMARKIGEKAFSVSIEELKSLDLKQQWNRIWR